MGGNSIVSMAVLKKALEDEGFRNVRTFINSGNVIFETRSTAKKTLMRKVEDAFEAAAGRRIPTLVLDQGDVSRVVAALPAGWVNDKVTRCDVVFLWPEADRASIVDELPLNHEVDDIKYVRGAVLWRIDRKNANRSRMNRLVGTPSFKSMTIRNANTARKLHQLMGGS